MSVGAGRYSLRDWQKGNRFSASHLQEYVTILRSILGVAGIDLNRDGTRAGDFAPYPFRFGRVVAKGPNDESDYTDERYWVQDAAIVHGADGDAQLDFLDLDPWQDGMGNTVPTIRTVSNLAEFPNHTHWLPTGAPVLFFVAQDLDELGADVVPNQRCVMLYGVAREIKILRIIGATQDATNKRWKYSWVEQYKAGEGYGGWSTGGPSGPSDDWGYAYNGIEDPNGVSGLYGNGVDSGNLTGTFDIQPVPVNTIVNAVVVRSLDGTFKPEPWFNYANGIDGACPTPG